jgi:hypothetical protein
MSCDQGLAMWISLGDGLRGVYHDHQKNPRLFSFTALSHVCRTSICVKCAYVTKYTYGTSLNVHYLSHLVPITSRSYVVLQLFIENVAFYRARSFMFYNVQTTYQLSVTRN